MEGPGRVAVLDRDAVLAAFDTSAVGLSEAQARARLARVGPNAIQEVPGPSWARRLLGQFTHLFARLLWAGSALAFAAGQVGIGIAIVAVIVLNGIFGLLQEHRAERAVAALRRLLPAVATVLRDGEPRRVPAEELVPGDLLVLEEGDRVSADARLIEAADVRCDESSLTGEAVPVHKTADPEPAPPATATQAHNVVFAGSTVTSGGGDGGGHRHRDGLGVRPDRGEAHRGPGGAEPLAGGGGPGGPAGGAAVGGDGRGVLRSRLSGRGLTLREGTIFAIGIVLGNVPEGLLPTMTLAPAMGCSAWPRVRRWSSGCRRWRPWGRARSSAPTRPAPSPATR
jgi:magnesium-transporting ATPase (P-type)